MSTCARVLLWAIALPCAMPQYLAAQHLAGQATNVSVKASARELIGTWRLVSITVEGAGGARSDPFYNTIGSGLLIYDPSGWVSVQIAGKARPAMDIPTFRPLAASDARTAKLRGELLDTYYAYFGTWDFDPQTSTVTHRVQTSLYPSEVGASYSQQVQLIGTRLVFSRTLKSSLLRSSLGDAVQKKVWERVGQASGAPH
jgi:hypothetical protein